MRAARRQQVWFVLGVVACMGDIGRVSATRQASKPSAPATPTASSTPPAAPSPASSSQTADTQWTVESPDGALAFTLRLADDATTRRRGTLSYLVERGATGSRREVIARSPLGVRRDDHAFEQGLRLVTARPPAAIDETYTMPHGKRLARRHQAREQTITFENASGALLDVIVRVANDGAAFRYRFSDAAGGTGTPRRHRLVSESTGFTLPASTTAWTMPQQPPGRYTPAYEDSFSEVPAGASAPTASGWAFPALFKIENGRQWLLISEAGVDERNAGTRLAQAAPNRQYRIRLPETGEGRKVGATQPSSSLPWTLPWRVLIVGDSLATIAESTLVEDLSPLSTVADTSWIRPGRASWSWWSEDNSPRDEKALKAFVDLSAAMGWEYTLIDANWNLMPPDALQRVIAYAREKRVGVLLWYNSGGPHNDVTEQPRDRMHTRAVRRAEFAKLREWGIAGVKVDFWQSDKQDRIQQYIELLRDAADHHLLVNFHGCTLPRGWARTYPHLIAMEGVMGAEQYKFNAQFPARAAAHNTILPFTRNVVGAMDYTPVTFTDHKHPRLTTDAHELALAVVFESGIQHFADSPSSYQKLPAAAQAFLKAVPSAWEETRLLAGEPGKQAIFARRAGRTWYVGGINGTGEPQSIDLDTRFLGDGSYRATLITDGLAGGGQPRQLSSEERTIGADGRLPMRMLPRGGFVATFERVPEAGDRRRAATIGGVVLPLPAPVPGYPIGWCIRAAAWRVPDGMAADRTFAELVAFARRFADAAARHDITVLVEPLRSTDSNTITTVAEALKLIAAVDRPNFALMVDYSFLVIQKENLATTLREAKPYLRHVHISNPEGRRSYPMEDRESDYATFFRALQEIGYRGGLSVHASTTAFTYDAPRAITFLRGYARTLAGSAAPAASAPQPRGRD